MAFHPRDKLLASGDTGKLIIWDTETSRSLKTFPFHTGLDCLLFSPDGKYLAAGYASSGGFVTIYERGR